MFNDKKGVSAIVATVLIIMITVAAVAIIWAAIIPMVKDSISGGTVCFDAESDVSLKANDLTCYEKDGNDTILKISIEKSNNEKVQLTGFNVQLISDGSSDTIRVGGNKESSAVVDGNKSIPGDGESKMIKINISNLSESNISAYEKVSIAPIAKSGSKEKLCRVVGEASISECL